MPKPDKTAPLPALRAMLDDHERRYGRGDLWRAASEEMAEVEADTARLDWCIEHGAGPMRADDGTWNVWLGDEWGNTYIAGSGVTPREAIDSAKGKCHCKEKS